MVIAALTEQTVSDDTVDVEHVKHRVRVLARQRGILTPQRSHLAETCSEYNDLVDLAHLLQKVVDAGTLDHVHIVCLRLNLDRDNVIGRGDHLLV